MRNLVLVGIGGAGVNAAERISNDNWIVIDSQKQVCKTKNHGKIILLDSEEISDIKALEINAALDGYDAVLVCVGLGGVTGSRITPKFIDLAKKQGKHVTIIAYMPFSFEGRDRTEIAQNTFEEIQKIADYSVCVSNDSLSKLGARKMSFSETFALGDLIIVETIKALHSIASEKDKKEISALLEEKYFVAEDMENTYIELMSEIDALGASSLQEFIERFPYEAYINGVIGLNECSFEAKKVPPEEAERILQSYISRITAEKEELIEDVKMLNGDINKVSSELDKIVF